MFSRRGFLTKIAALSACVAIAPRIAFGLVEKLEFNAVVFGEFWTSSSRFHMVQTDDYKKAMSEMISRAATLSKQLS